MVKALASDRRQQQSPAHTDDGHLRPGMDLIEGFETISEM
jgi:hypothetical protein